MLNSGVGVLAIVLDLSLLRSSSLPYLSKHIVYVIM